MKKSIYFIFSFFLLGILNCNAQSVCKDSVDKKEQVKVDSPTIEKDIQKKCASIEMLEYLGSHYYMDEDFQKSKLYFHVLFRKYKLA